MGGVGGGGVGAWERAAPWLDAIGPSAPTIAAVPDSGSGARDGCGIVDTCGGGGALSFGASSAAPQKRQNCALPSATPRHRGPVRVPPRALGCGAAPTWTTGLAAMGAAA